MAFKLQYSNEFTLSCLLYPQLFQIFSCSVLVISSWYFFSLFSLPLLFFNYRSFLQSYRLPWANIETFWARRVVIDNKFILNFQSPLGCLRLNKVIYSYRFYHHHLIILLYIFNPKVTISKLRDRYLNLTWFRKKFHPSQYFWIKWSVTFG